MVMATWDPVWERIFSTVAWGKYPPEPVIRGVMRAFSKVPDRHQVRILDLGCGTGANTWFLAREGFSVAGIDGSPTAITLNRQRLGEDGLEADLRVGDFTAVLPWTDETFSMIIDNASLYANPLPAIQFAIDEAYRLCAPGGRFVSLSFTDKTWGFGLGKPGQDPGAYSDITEGPLAGKGFVQFLTKTQIRTLFKKFSQVSIETTSYSLNEGEKLIELWVVEARK